MNSNLMEMIGWLTLAGFLLIFGTAAVISFVKVPGAAGKLAGAGFSVMALTEVVNRFFNVLFARMSMNSFEFTYTLNVMLSLFANALGVGLVVFGLLKRHRAETVAASDEAPPQWGAAR